MKFYDRIHDQIFCFSFQRKLLHKNKLIFLGNFFEVKIEKYLTIMYRQFHSKLPVCKTIMFGRQLRQNKQLIKTLIKTFVGLVLLKAFLGC